MSATWDAVIVGGGHNGLVAAAYLAGAGQRVLLLEALEETGGAAVSEHAFDGVDARLSRYSYLVSLFPPRILTDLGIDLVLARRRISSYTPNPADGGATGLLVDTGDEARTAASFARTGAAADLESFHAFYEHCQVLTRALWPTLTEPLVTRGEARDRVLAGGDPRAAAVWEAMVERPIGEVIAGNHEHDLVRGVLLTDALIGTFAAADDPGLEQNRCFLYHLLGQGDGRWDVPVGGMGALTDALALAARRRGATILTRARVTSITPDGEIAFVREGGAGQGEGEPGETDPARSERARAHVVLAGVAPTVVDRLAGAPITADAPRATGSQVKVNLVLRRLPRLRDPHVSPAEAFAGTFHINEGWSQLEAARVAAASGAIPDPLPCEVYCHSLTDPSILSPELRASGAHTLTVFGLHVPDALGAGVDDDVYRTRLQNAVLRSVSSVLAEPIEDVLLTDANGRPCVETRTTSDLDADLGMSGGNIFHGGLQWPWLEGAESPAADPGSSAPNPAETPSLTPAQRWGVATAWERVLLCGSGSRRGGAVSGLGGFAAAQAVLTASP